PRSARPIDPFGLAIPLPNLAAKGERRMSAEPSRSFSPRGLERRHLLEALIRLKKGDFSVRLEHGEATDGRIAEGFNDVVELNQHMSVELARLGELVGRQGRISERASLGDARGAWAASVRSVNTLIEDLSRPTIETARVIGAVAKGDLSQTMELSASG